MCLLIILWGITVFLWGYGVLSTTYIMTLYCVSSPVFRVVDYSNAQRCSETETTKKYNDVYQFSGIYPIKYFHIKSMVFCLVNLQEMFIFIKFKLELSGLYL